MNKAAYAGALAAGALTAYLCAPVPVSAQRGGTGSKGGKMEIPVQKSGKVVMSDGSPLPEPVDVEKFCGGSVGVPIAKTDSKGGFVVGSGRSGESDARLQNTSSLSRNQDLSGCALQARLPGYQSSTLRVVDNGQFDLGTIVLSRRAGVEGSAFSATSLKAPKDAQKDYEKAKQAIDKKKPDQARPLLEKAVKAYPEHAMAWFELGRIYQSEKDLAQARNAFEQAIKADPKFISPYLSLGAIANAEKNWKATADLTAAVIKLDPFDYPAAYAFNAMSNFQLGNDAAAEVSARKVLEMEAGPSFPLMEFFVGMIEGSRGNTKSGAEHLNNFLRLSPDSPAAGAAKKQLADWEKAGAGK